MEAVQYNKLMMDKLVELPGNKNASAEFLNSSWAGDEKAQEKKHQADLARNIVLLDELKKITNIFNEQEIPIIVLKGAAFLDDIYPDISKRQMHDIDVLIKKQDLERSNKVLSSAGYKSLHDYKKYLNVPISPFLNSLVYKKKLSISFYLHLHWHLVNTTIPATTYFDKINLKKIWQEAECLDNGFFILSKHHTIIHLSEHAMNHFYAKTYLLEDIDLFVRKYNKQIDWKKVIEDARSFGLEKFVYYTLAICSSILQTMVPENVIKELAPEKLSFIEKHFFNKAKKGQFSRMFAYASYLTMEREFLKRLEFIFKYLFRPQAVTNHIKNLG